jgi:cytochrome b subunit of formate dehydrogenase
MLQLLSALGLFGTGLLLLACLRLRRSRASGAAGAQRFPGLERLVLCCAALSFIALALSGFGSRLTGQALRGYLLLLHVGCGGGLAAAFPLTLLVLGPRFGFEVGSAAGPAYCPGHRLGFWLLALALIGVMVTPLVAMLPLLGSDGQVLLVALHRGCGLAALALALSLTYAEARLRQAQG